jgi:hypothetical protein
LAGAVVDVLDISLAVLLKFIIEQVGGLDLGDRNDLLFDL